jgi:adenylate kinase
VSNATTLEERRPRTCTNLLLVGPPGSGKGTQALRISRVLAIPQLSTGELLRDAIRLGTPLGTRAGECVAAGRLVPDALVNELVRAHLEPRSAREHGILLDGFPRNVEQLRALLEWLAPEGLSAAIELVVPSGVVMERLATRGRTDDTAAGVRERLRAFTSETSPMLRELERDGLLVSIDANRPVTHVTAEIMAAIGERAPRVPARHDWIDARR